MTPENDKTLQSVADAARDAIAAKNNEEKEDAFEDLSEFEEAADEEVIEEAGSAFDDDDDAVIASGYDVPKASDLEDPLTTANGSPEKTDITDDDLFDDDLESPEEFELSDDMIKENLSGIEGEMLDTTAKKIHADVEAFRKDLIVNQGFSVEEANKAAYNRATKIAEEEVASYKNENPSVAVIEVERGDDGKLNIPEEARDKVVKSKILQLKVVEDATLNHLEIENVPKRNKTALLNSLNTGLSQYAVPLPIMNDYVQFKGSQIIQLVQAVQYEDATQDEIINKKASLIYNQLVSGANLKKMDENGKSVMSYTEFCNKFPFHDIELALYAILVASSMENIESTLTCGECGESFTWTYNIKSLLNLDDLSDPFKERFDTILGHKSDTEYLQSMYEEHNVSWRVESPITHTIYDLDYPSIARAIDVQRHVDKDDATALYLSMLAMFVNRMYVRNNGTGKYIELDSGKGEYKEIFDILSRVPQEELDILMKYLADKLYSPKFILNTKCDKCGHSMVNHLSIEDMVFLRARDSQTEIR